MQVDLETLLGQPGIGISLDNGGVSYHVGHVTLVLDLGEEFQCLVGESVFGQSVEYLDCIVEQTIFGQIVEDFLQVFGVIGLLYDGLVIERVVRWWKIALFVDFFFGVNVILII